MITATIIKNQDPDPHYGRKPWVQSEEEITAADEDALFALFFREYDNRYKYCNSLNYRFKDEAMRAKYIEWFSDVSNYANNGGDMW